MSSLERQLDVTVQQYNAVVKQNKELQKELNTYKKAIENIKKEVFTCDRCKEECLNSDCDDCEYDYMEKIKQIINEVESE